MLAGMSALPTIDAVRAAGQLLEGVVHRTPVRSSRRLNAHFGCQFYFKCENFQRIGAFKIRGAYNAIAQLTAEQRRAGVVTFSSGNHAQAVALAARLLGVSATVVMPDDAPAIKQAATRGYGATIVHYDRNHQDREAVAKALAAEHGQAIVPPFDHPHVLAGQGTAALELFLETGPLDMLFVPLGGGGLLSGSLLAARALSPGCRVIGVEPTAGDDGHQSLQAGKRITIQQPHSIADGALTRQLGELTFQIIQREVDDIALATDEQLCVAMRCFAETMKMVVEPTGCLGAAAAFAMPAAIAGKRIGVLISGGNVDMVAFGQYVAGVDSIFGSAT